MAEYLTQSWLGPDQVKTMAGSLNQGKGLGQSANFSPQNQLGDPQNDRENTDQSKMMENRLSRNPEHKLKLLRI